MQWKKTKYNNIYKIKTKCIKIQNNTIYKNMT